jgi:hypothetical protein
MWALGEIMSSAFSFTFEDADSYIFSKDMYCCRKSNLIVARNRVLVPNIDIIAMRIYLCCRGKERNDILIHFAIQ